MFFLLFFYFRRRYSTFLIVPKCPKTDEQTAGFRFSVPRPFRVPIKKKKTKLSNIPKRRKRFIGLRFEHRAPKRMGGTLCYKRLRAPVCESKPPKKGRKKKGGDVEEQLEVVRVSLRRRTAKRL